MANAEDQRDYCLWDIQKSFTHKPKKVPVNDAFNVKHKRGGSAFSSSASTQKLRDLNLNNQKKDSSSPKGVLEACVNGFDCPPSPELETGCSNSKTLFQWSKIFKQAEIRSFRRLTSFPPIGASKIAKGKSRTTGENPVLSNIHSSRSSLVIFGLSDLRNATNNFSNENIIGRGGYSEVYKGRLQDGQLIAVKRLTKGTPDERTANLLCELGIMAHVDHPNTAKFIGCGVEGGMHLVFQLSPLGSLGSLLHGSKDDKLDWSKRYKIALGIADGLLYLHESCPRRIIHRDIKAENILLTQNFEPQICDFGLAKWLPEKWTHHIVSKFEGTFGYFAPEYLMHGIVDEKTDVYSFGVLLLELITGRQALDHLQQSVVIWAKPLLDSTNKEDLVDPSLGGNYDPEQMDCVILTASLCVEQSPMFRPPMSQVAILLRGEECALEPAKASESRSLPRTYSQELLDAQEYNSTKYLSDLNRHRQVALGS